MYKILLFSLFIINTLSAAAPATHLYLAEQLKVEETDRELLFRGSVFPDIRYLAKIPRDTTHISNVTKEQVLNEQDPFRKGILFHCYVDDKRESIVLEHNMYSHIEQFACGHPATLLKLVEDEITYTINTYESNFTTPLYPQEIGYSIDDALIRQWNAFLKRYLSKKPSEFLKKYVEEQKSFLHFDVETIDLWVQVIPELAQDPTILNYFKFMTLTIAEDFKN